MTSEILQLQQELNQIIRNEAALLRIQLMAHEAGSLADRLVHKNSNVAVSRRETQILSLISRLSDAISKSPSVDRLAQLFKRLALVEPYAAGMAQSKVDKPSIQ